MARRLLSTRRVVPLDRLDEYLEVWARLRTAVGERGGRAWLFRSSVRQDQLLEFVEWPDHPAHAAGPATLDAEWIAAARATLDQRFGTPQAEEEWEEVQ